jgi:hypothetical protein
VNKPVGDKVMQEAARLEFERAAHEFSLWRSVAEEVRSPAPAWWWGTAMRIKDDQQQMPPLWCKRMELPLSSSYAQAAAVLMNSIADQTSLPWPDEFPRKVKRELAEPKEP